MQEPLSPTPSITKSRCHAEFYQREAHRYEVIVDDPGIDTKPWKNTRTFSVRPDWKRMEYPWMETNKDLLEGHIK